MEVYDVGVCIVDVEVVECVGVESGGFTILNYGVEVFIGGG